MQTHLDLLSKTQIRRRSGFLTRKTLSIVSTVILPYETKKNYALIYIILYVNQIENHQNCLSIANNILPGRYNPGDPFAMSTYGITIIPLIELLDDCSTVQKWYANDGNGVGFVDNLKNRWNRKTRSFFRLPSYHIPNHYQRRFSWKSTADFCTTKSK